MGTEMVLSEGKGLSFLERGSTKAVCVEMVNECVLCKHYTLASLLQQK